MQSMSRCSRRLVTFALAIRRHRSACSSALSASLARGTRRESPGAGQCPARFLRFPARPPRG
eukprot:1087527-Alexandrium_andersonii.AAC.1